MPACGREYGERGSDSSWFDTALWDEALADIDKHLHPQSCTTEVLGSPRLHSARGFAHVSASGVLPVSDACQPDCGLVHALPQEPSFNSLP